MFCERPSLTGEDSNTSQRQRQLMTHLSKKSGYDGYLEHVRWSNAEICMYIYRIRHPALCGFQCHQNLSFRLISVQLRDIRFQWCWKSCLPASLWVWSWLEWCLCGQHRVRMIPFHETYAVVHRCPLIQLMLIIWTTINITNKPGNVTQQSPNHKLLDSRHSHGSIDIMMPARVPWHHESKNHGFGSGDFSMSNSFWFQSPEGTLDWKIFIMFTKCLITFLHVKKNAKLPPPDAAL